MKDFLFTSEAVTEGHPDKICDLIADTILDYALASDPDSQMAVEASIKNNEIWVFGEAKTSAKIPYAAIARDVLKKIGYTEYYDVTVSVSEQSPEINQAVVGSGELAAGDQGIMFGYACNETDNYMPFPIYWAQKLAKELNYTYHLLPAWLGPDGKTQVTVKYSDGRPEYIDTIVVSTQHKKDTTRRELEAIVMDLVFRTIPEKYITDDTNIIINPSGSFVMGGSFADSGTTGRKIVCDTYGGIGRTGGGSLCSKSPTKVDRSAAYYCRYVAKNIVANGLADKCEVQVAYAIGLKDPVSVCVDTFNTGKQSDMEILDIVRRNFDFSVENIIKELDLKRPIYARTTNYGHFGKEEFPWEQIKELEM